MAISIFEKIRLRILFFKSVFGATMLNLFIITLMVAKFMILNSLLDNCFLKDRLNYSAFVLLNITREVNTFTSKHS